jgi:hypothetical protein
MGVAMNRNDERATAIEAALEGDWERAHRIVQDLGDAVACWTHAILHKIEGDASNSRYWYARSGGRRFDDFTDAHQELHAALRVLRGE